MDRAGPILMFVFVAGCASTAVDERDAGPPPCEPGKAACNDDFDCSIDYVCAGGPCASDKGTIINTCELRDAGICSMTGGQFCVTSADCPAPAPSCGFVFVCETNSCVWSATADASP